MTHVLSSCSYISACESVNTHYLLSCGSPLLFLTACTGPAGWTSRSIKFTIKLLCTEGNRMRPLVWLVFATVMFSTCVHLWDQLCVYVYVCMCAYGSGVLNIGPDWTWQHGATVLHLYRITRCILSITDFLHQMSSVFILLQIKNF